MKSVEAARRPIICPLCNNEIEVPEELRPYVEEVGCAGCGVQAATDLGVLLPR